MRVLNWEKWMMSRNWEQGETMKGRMDIATGGNGCPKVLWRRVYGPEWELKKFHYSWSAVWRAGLGRESVILGPVGHFKYHDLYPNITAAAKSLQSCPTVQPHRRRPTRHPRPWDSPGKYTGVGCHFLLQYMKVKSESKDPQRPHGLQPSRLLPPNIARKSLKYFKL